MKNLQVIKSLSEKYIVPTYKRLPVAFESGEGCKLFDSEGREYLDFLSGIAVNNLGHSHPKVVEAICEQVKKLTHTSNLYLIEPQAVLAELLVEQSFPGKVFFCNSGAEANEAVIKLVRKWGKQSDKSDKYEIITALQSFHGRTLTTITATGQEKYQKSFTPLTPGFKYVPYNDLAATEEAITEKTAAIMVEPVQGEGGVNIPDPGYIKGLRDLCDSKGILLIFDEVQTGIGRTGRMFGFQHFNVTPDAITLAKGLGSGFPIGAMIAGEKIADVFQPGDHAATFGGNYLACAAALATLKTVLDEDLCAAAKSRGEYLVAKLETFRERFSFIRQVRGIGLMVRMELTIPGQAIVDSCLQKGLIINCIQEKVLRFVPPLIVSEAEINQAVGVLQSVLLEVNQ